MSRHVVSPSPRSGARSESSSLSRCDGERTSPPCRRLGAATGLWARTEYRCGYASCLGERSHPRAWPCRRTPRAPPRGSLRHARAACMRLRLALNASGLSRSLSTPRCRCRRCVTRGGGEKGQRASRAGSSAPVALALWSWLEQAKRRGLMPFGAQDVPL